MHNSSNRLSFIHFADDTTLSVVHNDVGQLQNILNEELTRVNDWLCCNRLSLNFSKTFYMLFSNRTVQNLDIVLRGVKIKKAKNNVVKFLGLLLDNRLNFVEYVRKLCGKISRACGVLFKVSEYLPQHCLRMLYGTLVLPHLIYCIEVWGCANSTIISRLSRLQDRFVRMLGRGNIGCVYRENKILPFEFLFEYFVLVKFFQNCVLHRNLYFQKLIDQLRPQHSYSTRFSGGRCLNFPKSRISKLHSSFLFKSIHFWNNLPIGLREINSIFSFKRELKKHLLERII